MNRTSGSGSRPAKRSRLLSKVKGFRGRRNRCYSLAKIAVKKSEQDSYIGRKLKKRYFKRMWNKTISIWAKNNGKRYSEIIADLINKYGDRYKAYKEIRSRGLSGDHMASDILSS